ncbi:hypothetical protein J6590_108391 [Homalodisca vitripennis]|nr:hypothetical protein J6590_108391 [Homalodisca vitripennis]
MGKLGPRESCRATFKELNILTVTSLYILETILYCLLKDFPRNSNLHEHNTRHGQDFPLPLHRTAVFEKKPTYAGKKLFNALPEEIKKIGNNHINMKTAIKNWLLQRTIYTVEEFYLWRLTT